MYVFVYVYLCGETEATADEIVKLRDERDAMKKKLVSVTLYVCVYITYIHMHTHTYMYT